MYRIICVVAWLTTLIMISAFHGDGSPLSFEAKLIGSAGIFLSYTLGQVLDTLEKMSKNKKPWSR